MALNWSCSPISAGDKVNQLATLRRRQLHNGNIARHELTQYLRAGEKSRARSITRENRADETMIQHRMSVWPPVS